MITDQLDFTGRIAIVTGGGTGIGYATAMQLARLGATVVVASRTAEELEGAAARIAAESGSLCLAVPTDVKDEASCVAMVQRPGEPDEIANMIVFFASDAASYITGQVMAVNGGPSLGGISLE